MARTPRRVPDGCPDVDTPWGETCRTCGQRLPDPVSGPPVGRTDRGLLFPSGSSAGLGERSARLVAARRARVTEGRHRTDPDGYAR
jgi:hypothetical protein